MIPFRVLLIVLMSVAGKAALSATIPSDIKKTVAFIFQADAKGEVMRDAKGNPVPCGTGFFVAVQNTPPRAGIYGYLVTAKHVLTSPEGRFFSRVFLRLNKLKGDAQYVPLDLAQDGRSIIFTHSDPTVDIAVVPALPQNSEFDFRMIPHDDVLEKSFDNLNISEGSEVFFTGLFISHVGGHRNNPIVRFGRVAMLPEEKIHWQENGKPAEMVELYLLETQSYGGNSGSPVFFFLGNDRVSGSIVLGPPVIKLAGIMRGSFNENRAIGFVQSAAVPPIPVSSQNIGIAAVTPGYLLRDILFSDALKKHRADHPVGPSMAK